MLGLFSNKSDHPLATLKSAQQLLDALPKADSIAVLQEVGHWIEALFDPANEFRLDHQFAVLRMLDDAAHPHLRRIIHSYFAVVPPTAFQENRLWGAMNAYFTFSELGYLHVLVGVRNGAKGSSSIRSNVALVSARGIYAASGLLECAAVRYGQIDPQLWVHLAEFYAYAEVEQCQDEQIFVYVGSGASTTLRSLFAGKLIWYASSIGSLRPVDLHIAKRLIVYMSKSFTTDDQCQADSLFTFDLDNPESPLRVKEEGAMYPKSVRFIGVGAAAKQLDDVLKTLGKNLVPEELGMGVAYNAEVVRNVANHLVKCCNASLPSHRPQRRRIRMNMNVANGFSNVIEHSDQWLNLSGAASECWEVEDISATGLRCVLPAGNASSVRIGTLVGLQPEKIEHWGAGIVRRLSRDAQNNLHVGVEMLASKVKSVTLHGSDALSTDAIEFGLLLDKPDAQEGEGWVLMRQDCFSIHRSPTMMQDDLQFLLLPLALVEKGADFDLARYRKMAADTSGDEVY